VLIVRLDLAQEDLRTSILAIAQCNSHVRAVAESRCAETSTSMTAKADLGGDTSDGGQTSSIKTA
jgi:hypothetical protein